MTDVQRILRTLTRQQAALHLETTDLCFLIALHVRAERAALASFEEELLYDVYEQVCATTEPEAQQLRKRATHAIQRLREQRLLARVDGSGFVRAGEYAMTRLAWAIVEQHIEEQVLTRESLTLLTHTLALQLEDIRNAALTARKPEEWKTRVVNPLRVTVSDLIGGIERRQRGLDAQQEDLRHEIAHLLQRDWFEAIEACEQLLQLTARTLQELNEVLMRDAARLQATLHDIAQRAFERQAAEAEETSNRVADHIDRVAAWGTARLQAWSEYFIFVQRYLRAVVRLDPHRALSQRLRDQLAGWTQLPFALVTAEQPRLPAMRALDTRPERPPVQRPAQDLEAVMQEIAPPEDARALPLETRVSNALQTRPEALSSVLKTLLDAVPDQDRYRTVGRIAALVAASGRVDTSVIDKPWTPVADDLEVEEWTVRWDELKP
jgi:chromosome partition protein MukF